MRLSILFLLFSLNCNAQFFLASQNRYPCANPNSISGTLTVSQGSQVTLSNSVFGGDWYSSNTINASILMRSGTATGLSAGTSTITYTTGIGCVATSVLTVTPSPYVAFDPINKGTNVTLSNADYTAVVNASSGINGIARTATGFPVSVSVKRYAEITVNTSLVSGNNIGLCNGSHSLTMSLGLGGAFSYGYATFMSTGYGLYNSSATIGGTGGWVGSFYNAPDVISVLLETNGVSAVMTVYRGGVTQGIFPYTGLTGTIYLAVSNYTAGVVPSYTLNTGNMPWASSTAAIRSSITAAGGLSWSGTSL